MFSSILTFTLDYYIKETNYLLVTNQASYTAANITQPSVNVGHIKNKGIDLTIGHRGRIAGQVDYDLSANFSTYKNEVIKILDNPKTVLYGGGTRMGNAAITRVGDPISSHYGYVIEGIFGTQAEVDTYTATTDNTWLPPAVGRWIIKDVSGPDGAPDNVINDYDRTVIGSPHPDFQMSFNISLAYKGFDFTSFIFWNQGGSIFNYGLWQSDFMASYSFNRSARMLYDSWTPENTDAELPITDVDDSYSNKYCTSYFEEDATYVRMMNLQLGYTLPQAWLNTIKVEKLRIFISG